MTRKDDEGDQPSGGETTRTNTGATRYGRGQHKTGSFGDDTLRPSPNHGTQRLPNDDDDDGDTVYMANVKYFVVLQAAASFSSVSSLFDTIALYYCYIIIND